jgi:ribosomal protein S18 acetylase RimI-like enzyme
MKRETTMTEATEQKITLRSGTADDLPRLSDVLARSFETCPAWGWYLPPESKNRVDRIQAFFAGLLREIYLKDGRECLVADDLSGAALVDPPDGWKMSAGENLRLLLAMLPAFRSHLTRPIRGFSLLDGGHPEEPHYYLSVLGVDPKAERGVADTLLTRVLDRCDSEGMSAYLETGRPKSRNFFQRFGFEVTEELRLPGDGPTVWRMWREPTAEGN